MNGVLRTVGVLTVVAHMLFGCCLHHAHAHHRLRAHASSIAAGCECGHHGPSRYARANEHGHQPHDAQPCDRQGERTDCHEGRCVFIRPDSSEDSLALSSQTALCVPPVACLLPQPTPNAIETAGLAPRCLSRPIGLYLLNQALLL